MSVRDLSGAAAACVAARRPRIVMVCDHAECVPPIRVFCSSEEEAAGWRCPEHGRGERQANRAYGVVRGS